MRPPRDYAHHHLSNGDLHTGTRAGADSAESNLSGLTTWGGGLAIAHGDEQKPPKKPYPFSITKAGGSFFAVTGFVLIATLSSGVNLLYFIFGVLVGVPIVSMMVASWTLRRCAELNAISAAM